MDDLLVRIRELAGGGLDGVNVSNQVGDCDVRGGELFAVALLTADPLDGSLIPFCRDGLPALSAHRVERIIVHLRPRDNGDLLIQQPHEAAQDPRLGLAAQSEQDEVMMGQEGVHKPRDHR